MNWPGYPIRPAPVQVMTADPGGEAETSPVGTGTVPIVSVCCLDQQRRAGIPSGVPAAVPSPRPAAAGPGSVGCHHHGSAWPRGRGSGRAARDEFLDRRTRSEVTTDQFSTPSTSPPRAAGTKVGLQEMSLRLRTSRRRHAPAHRLAMIEELLVVLAEAGLNPEPRELRDALWLAQHLAGPAADARPGGAYIHQPEPAMRSSAQTRKFRQRRLECRAGAQRDSTQLAPGMAVLPFGPPRYPVPQSPGCRTSWKSPERCGHSSAACHHAQRWCSMRLLPQRR